MSNGDIDEKPKGDLAEADGISTSERGELIAEGERLWWVKQWMKHHPPSIAHRLLSALDRSAILVAVVIVLYLATVVTGTAYTGSLTVGCFTNPPGAVNTYLNWSAAALVLSLMEYGVWRTN